MTVASLKPNWLPSFHSNAKIAHDTMVNKCAVATKSTSLLVSNGTGQSYNIQEFSALLHENGHTTINYRTCSCRKAVEERVYEGPLIDKKHNIQIPHVQVYKYKKGNTYKLRAWDGFNPIPIFAFKEARPLIEAFIK